MAQKFSFADMYGSNTVTSQLPTADQTIPDTMQEIEYAGVTETTESTDSAAGENANGMKSPSGNNKNLVLGSLLLIVIVLVMLHLAG